MIFPGSDYKPAISTKMLYTYTQINMLRPCLKLRIDVIEQNVIYVSTVKPLMKIVFFTVVPSSLSTSTFNQKKKPYAFTPFAPHS